MDECMNGWICVCLKGWVKLTAKASPVQLLKNAIILAGPVDLYSPSLL